MTTVIEALTIGTLAEVSVASFAPTLASLPASFTPSIGANVPDVTVIDGGEGWALQVADAIRTGSRGIVVSAPSSASSHDVRFAADLADRHGAHVMLAEPFAGDPGLLEHLFDIANHMAAVDSVAIKHISRHQNSEDQLLAVLRTARSVGYSSIRLDSYVRTAHGFTANGIAPNGAVFAALGVSSPAASVGQSVRGYGFARTVSLELFGAETASPAFISVTNVDGELRLPTVYETADRATWQKMRDALSSSPINTSLHDFADDLDAVSAAQ